MAVHKKRVSVVHTELVRERTVLYENEKRTITSPQEAASFAASFIFNGKEDREKFYVCCIDTKGEPVAVSEIGVGGRSSCQVDIVQIFKLAILSSCNGIICFHNHPTHSVEPSDEDKKLTAKVRETGDLLGVKMLDHIIIGGERFYSFMSLREGTI